MLAVYGYAGAQDQELIYSAILIVHIFLLSILLLNFMVAILSTTYGLMLESGSFMYKCILFEYCYRYVTAFTDITYGELALHAAPINCFCIILLPFTPFRQIMDRISILFSYFIFWVENIFFLAGFIGFELILSPLIYMLTIFNIIYSTNGLFKTVYNVFIWVTFGCLYLFYLLMRDVAYLLYILYQHNGCKESLGHVEENDEDEGLSQEQQIGVFNDLRVCAIKLYNEIKKQAKKTTEGGEEPKEKEREEEV